MYKLIYSVVFVGVLFLTGCADAGKDQSVIENTIVSLDGNASTPDVFGKIKKYKWKQVEGKK